jgi:hypothetical protein
MHRLGMDFSEVLNVLDAFLHVVDALDLNTHDSIQRDLSLDERLPVKEACWIVFSREVIIYIDYWIISLSTLLLRGGGNLNDVMLLS